MLQREPIPCVTAIHSFCSSFTCKTGTESNKEMLRQDTIVKEQERQQKQIKYTFNTTFFIHVKEDMEQST